MLETETKRHAVNSTLTLLRLILTDSKTMLQERAFRLPESTKSQMQHSVLVEGEQTFFLRKQ